MIDSVSATLIASMMALCQGHLPLSSSAVSSLVQIHRISQVAELHSELPLLGPSLPIPDTVSWLHSIVLILPACRLYPDQESVGLAEPLA
jgi:hypothetical protein